jgi:hypothetical protein
MKRLDRERRDPDILRRTPVLLVRKSDLAMLNYDIAPLRAIQARRPAVGRGSGGGAQTI